MLRIDIFDSETYALKDMCFQYTSMRFERKFRGVGTFTIELNSLDEAAKFKKRDWLLLGSDWYMVEGIHKYIDDSWQTKVEITGSHANKIMKYRVFTSHEFPEGQSYEQNMIDLVNAHFGANASADRQIPNLIIDDHSDNHVASSNTTMETNDVCEALNVYSAREKLGYSVYLVPEDGTIHFKVLEPKDCTKTVFFSEEYGNLQSSEVYDNCADVINTNLKYIRAEDQYTDETFEYDQIHESAVPHGIKRHEALVECSGGSASSNYSTETLSASASLISTASSEYRTDFDIGSVVNFYDQDLRIQSTQQIKTVVENHSEIATYTVEIGDFVPTVFDKILNEVRRRK